LLTEVDSRPAVELSAREVSVIVSTWPELP